VLQAIEINRIIRFLSGPAQRGDNVFSRLKREFRARDKACNEKGASIFLKMGYPEIVPALRFLPPLDQPELPSRPGLEAGFFSSAEASISFQVAILSKESHPLGAAGEWPRSMRVATLSTSVHPGVETRSQPKIGVKAPLGGSIVQNVLAALDEMKAEDVISIDLRGKTALADEMIIATGRSTVHVGAIADKATKAFKEAGVTARVEGLPQCDWVLIDAGDIIIHIFRPEVRQFYNLEKMWGGDRPVEMRLV
jgi:ribosome-associated protein